MLSRALCSLQGLLKVNWPQVRGQTKNHSQRSSMKVRGGRKGTLPRGSPGHPSKARLRRRACQGAPGGWVCCQPSQAQAKKMTQSLPYPANPLPTGGRCAAEPEHSSGFTQLWVYRDWMALGRDPLAPYSGSTSHLVICFL